MRRMAYLLVATCLGGMSAAISANAAEVTIATVNNNDMLTMKALSPRFEKETGIKLNWVVMNEVDLKNRVTTDVSTHAGQFDIVTIGPFEAQVWGRLNWLMPENDLGSDYDYDDLLKPIRDSLSVNGTLFAAPFYGESSFTMYRKDLFRQAGLTMPDEPTWDQMDQFAAKLTDRSKGIYGICLRGKPGWGENMDTVTTMANSYGGRWFDMKWKAQLTTPPWEKAVTEYVHLLKDYGPPGATSNGFNENLSLFATGHCAMWVDATVAASTLFDPKQSKVADAVAIAAAPHEVTSKGSAWLWAWSLGIPAGSKHAADAKKFVAWATSKEYIKLVADQHGWIAAPPGTRHSTYATPAYIAAAPFARTVEKAISAVDFNHPTLLPVPYVGLHFVAIAPYPGIGTMVGQNISAALAGSSTVRAALAKSDTDANRAIEQSGLTGH